MKITDLPNFLELNPKHIKDKKFSKIDFLEALLKNITDKKEIKDIILHSNITKEQKEKLLQKFLAKFDKLDNKKLTASEIKKSIKPLITKIILNKDKKINEKKESPTENSLLASLIHQPHQSPKEITKEIKKLPKKQQTQIVTEIKILLKKSSNTHIQTIISTKQFKEAKNFEDIINVSKKYKLNLTKVAIAQIKENLFNKSQKTAEISKNEILTSVIKQKLDIRKTDSKDKSSKIEPPKNLKNDINIADLLNKNNKETKVSQNFNITDLLKKDTKTDKHKTDNNDFNIINTSITDTTVKQNIISAKQTLKHFASSLKEAVENYKPPVSKLTLELHPKDLGKVEVTIKQRGDNLNVQINTNNTPTINFFTSSQQELKNSLVNMGFTNINMSFNANQDNQQQKNQTQQKYSKNNNNEDEELIIDFSYKYA